MNAIASIRVLLAVDGLAGDLIERRLRADDAFDVIGRTHPKLVLGAAQHSRPDFVVIPLGDPPFELLDAVPRMKVLGLEVVAGRAYLTELLRDVSPDDLAAALRRASARGEG
jgi:hypothetical protein